MTWRILYTIEVGRMHLCHDISLQIIHTFSATSNENKHIYTLLVSNRSIIALTNGLINRKSTWLGRQTIIMRIYIYL